MLTMAFPRPKCGDKPSNTRSDSGHFELDLELMSAGFNSPVFLVSPPQRAEQLFVAKQRDNMRIIKRGIVLLESFLDIRNRVRFYDERGQLNVTFHPRFADNHRLFGFYTNKRGTSEFLASSSEPYRALAESERRLTCYS